MAGKKVYRGVVSISIDIAHVNDITLPAGLYRLALVSNGLKMFATFAAVQ